MARGINKAIIVGTLGQDPDVRATAAGSTVVTISVATNEVWRDRQTGDNQERTEWHRIVMFGKLGEIAAQYLKKGSQAYFEGKIQTRKWQDQSGNDRYTTEIVANEMQMLGGGANTGTHGRSQATADQYRSGRDGGSSGGGRDAQPPQAAAAAGAIDDGYDDIPF